MQRYGESWGSLMHAVRGGTSWSGGERNRCLLNISGKGFADASPASGLDFADDGRAVAVTDWNRDGKLDLWFRNRTAPRLRLMMNQKAEGRFLSLRLQGVHCNRDAIGAVVQLDLNGKPLLRSVRAGEMFLSQSSKWLHFGLGNEEEVDSVMVHWPGGKKEEFVGLKPGGRFVLQQGTGAAKSESGPEAVEIEPKKVGPKEKIVRAAGIRLPVAIPVPALTYRDAAMKAQKLQATGRSKLILIWESSCERCAMDLSFLESQRQKLSSVGVDILVLSADKLEDSGNAYDRIDASRYSGAWGFCDPASLLALWKWQAAWFDRRIPASVPFGILLDGRGYGVALYRGGIDPEAVIMDARELINTDPTTRWHLAPHLKGTWFTNPLSGDYVLNSIRAKMRAGK